MQNIEWQLAMSNLLGASAYLAFHSSQRPQRRPLGVGDARQPCDVQALVATLGP